mgnify:CR=1 FL=1
MCVTGMACGAGRDDVEQRGGQLQAFGRCTAGGHFSPVGAAFFFCLQYFELHMPSSWGQSTAQHKLVVVRVGQGVACGGRPGDFGHAFGHFFAMVVIRGGEGADLGGQHPACLGHGLGPLEAVGDGNPQRRGGRTFTAVADPQGGTVGGARQRSLVGQGDMGKRSAGAYRKSAGSYGFESKRSVHGCKK